MTYDISIIRPEMHHDDVKLRGRDYPAERRREIRKGLQTLHTMEVMAVNIYKSQIGSKPCALNTQLSAALCNELTHMQDFLTKLFEFGFKPSKLRWTYWLVGYVFGLSSRTMGEAVILKTAVWTEEKAIAHYTKLLAGVPWDEETQSFVEKDQADEIGHAERWRELLRDRSSTC